MSYGLQIRNSSNYLIFTSLDITWTIIGSITTCSNGSTFITANPNFSNFQIVITPISGSASFGENKALPDVSYSNGVLSWSYSRTPLCARISILGR